ncbi:CHAT domain-containing protein [Psychroserpens jangbogonensis]|uniref:CHAT domain-containing protein n=1 Tax=Psychroserpens jangbogonensis TaxID=1484460 RepID=UPI00053D3FD7|nr:CHAT domain-containing tetratricopeptide repeat protein [Psychroserpens jangbogonensis]
MNLKTIILILGYLCYNYSVAQTPIYVKTKLEKIADSIYFNKTESYSANDYKVLQDLRHQIISKNKDTSSINYKTALFKRQASDAIVYQFNSKNDEAIVASKKALKSYNKHHINDKYFKGHLVKYLSHQYSNNSNWEKSLEMAQATRAILKDTLVYNHPLIAQAEFNIGNILSVYGDQSKVIEHYKKAITLNVSNRGEYNSEVAYHKHHLALTYGFVGYYKKELETYLDVVRIWEAIPYKDKSYLNIAYVSLNTWYIQHGDYAKAEEYIIKSENLIKSHKTNLSNWFNETYRGRTQINLWSNYASLYLLKKDTVKAITYNNKISDFFSNYDEDDKRNNPNNLSYFKDFINIGKLNALRFKANILKLKNPKEAKAIYEQIINLQKNNAVALFALSDKLNLIRLHLNDKAYKTAELKVNSWINKISEEKEPYFSMVLRGEQAHIAIAQDSVNLMHKYYSLAFKDLHKDVTKPVSIKNINYNDCKPYSNNDFIDLLLKASKDYQHAFSATNRKFYLEIAHNLSKVASDAFSDNYLFSEFNDTTYDIVVQINEQLLSTSILLNDKSIQKTILEKIEESNSKISWRKFLNNTQRKAINIPDSILNTESNLKNELHFYKKQLFINNESDNNNKIIKEKIFDLNKSIDNLNIWFKENYRSYFNQTRQKFNLNALKEKLNPNQRIIKYCFTQKSVYAFAISKSSTKLIKISTKAKLSQLLKKTIDLLKDTNNTNYEQYLHQLYVQLLPSSILKDENHQDLIFVLDDLLYYFPLEILMNANGKHLIENHSISYAASLLLWNEQTEVEKSKNNKLGIYSPTYNDENSQLNGANYEASQISKLFKSDVFLGKKASKETFLATAKNYSLLHLAMHSSVNNTHSEFSNLNFGSTDDEKLFISELYNMSLNADLAVLSACDTGVGNLKRGEGLINVSKAFTYAGVPSTVTSLWKVPDKETSQIMESFYSYLKSGEPKNKALQLAKLDYLNTIEDSFLKHPFYWAGFVLSGDISAIKSEANYWWLTFILIPLFLFLIRKPLVKIFN